MQYNKI